MTSLGGRCKPVDALPRRPVRPTAPGERGGWPATRRQPPASDAARPHSPARPLHQAHLSSASSLGNSGGDRGGRASNAAQPSAEGRRGVARRWWGGAQLAIGAPLGVNPAGEASTLPEKGDKVLARHARRSARPATPVAGVLEGHGGAQNKAAATAPAYSPKKKTRKMRSCILVLCLLFTLIIRRTIWPLQNGSFGRSRPDNLSALKKPFASMHFALLQATEPLCGEALVSCGVIFSGTARVRSSVRNDLMDRVST